MKDVTTFLFDVDGTLLDTREFILQATEHTLREYGFAVPPRSEIAKFVGKGFDEYYFLLCGRRESLDMQQTHRAFLLANMGLAVVYPNTEATLRKLRDKGYKLSAVTTRSKITSIETLERAGILEYFHTVISNEDTPHVKPHPGPLLKALEELKELPVGAVMVGDSNYDVEAGKNAGTRTVRALYGFHQDKTHDPEPDYFIKDISELLSLLP